MKAHILREGRLQEFVFGPGKLPVHLACTRLEPADVGAI